MRFDLLLQHSLLFGLVDLRKGLGNGGSVGSEDPALRPLGKLLELQLGLSFSGGEGREDLLRHRLENEEDEEDDQHEDRSVLGGDLDEVPPVLLLHEGFGLFEFGVVEGEIGNLQKVAPGLVVAHGGGHQLADFRELLGAPGSLVPDLLFPHGLFHHAVVDDDGDGETFDRPVGELALQESLVDLVVLGLTLHLTERLIPRGGDGNTRSGDVGSGARSSSSHGVSALLALRFLAPLDLDVGVVDLFHLLLFRKIQLRPHVGADLTDSHDRFEQGVDLPGDLPSHLLLNVDLLGAENGDLVAALRRGQESAVDVDHRDVLRGEAFDGGGCQVDNGSDRRGRDRGPRVEAEDDGGLRGFLLFQEDRFLGKDDVDPGRLHLLDRRDGSGEFPFQGSQVVHLLHELGHPQLALVEDFEADAAPFRDSLGGQGEAELVDLFVGDQDGRSPQGVLDLHLLQLRDDLPRVVFGEVGEEDGLFRGVGPENQCRQASQDGEDHHGDEDLLGVGELLQNLSKLGEGVHGLPHTRTRISSL